VSTSIPSSGFRDQLGFEVGGRACVQSGTSTLYCVNILSGSVVSSAPTPELLGAFAPRSAQDVRYLSSNSGGGISLRSLNTETGQTTSVGTISTAAEEGVSSHGGFDRTSGQVFFVVYGPTTQRLLFVDVETGQTRESRTLSEGIGGPLLMRGDGRIIAVTGT
jgi:hypothetical protein